MVDDGGSWLSVGFDVVASDAPPSLSEWSETMKSGESAASLDEFRLASAGRGASICGES